MENTANYSILLRGLAEIRRHQIIQSKFNQETKNLYSDAYVYAIANSIYPYEHEQLGSETDKEKILLYFPFYETYKVSYDQVKNVAELLDNKWKKESITFYELEAHYSGTWEGSMRADLIDICRYLYLCRYFDQPFWDHFLSDRPTEANSIAQEYLDLSELEQTKRILER